ncbi:MAG: hypothetical protein ABSG92_01850 [Conexivisphaerales archaeon]
MELLGELYRKSKKGLQSFLPGKSTEVDGPPLCGNRLKYIS